MVLDRRPPTASSWCSASALARWPPPVLAVSSSTPRVPTSRCGAARPVPSRAVPRVWVGEVLAAVGVASALEDVSHGPAARGGLADEPLAPERPADQQGRARQPPDECPIPAAVACRLARMRAKSRAFQREVAPDIDAMSDRSGGG